ncbi:putative MFS family arabinose efflux permease [Zhihengliuella halotolerans]|uniref:Putative MFS family arabinose efflux permease n=2 Tax=Zhihengliuella halotolerans TaxID=370736 RepID=A0A4V2GAB8_9MICC|nr:putative MFS family arabinose efflux permease [Zhihengliuella halotolerans]
MKKAIRHSGRSNQRRVAMATLVGTTVEWYDYFIYAMAAGLVFSSAFFEPVGQELGLLIAFASVGISFLFRPLGAFLAGHYGDRIGRRAMLVLTLVVMGGATTAVGLLPTYHDAGIIAPIILLCLRILQGLSAGGEWGGAVLMAVEHAPKDRRGRAGAFPQLGAPLGLVMASAMMALMSGVIAPGDAFVEWGWRIPFLFSFVLIILGYIIRRAVDESPVFQEIAEHKQQSSVPVVELFRKHSRLVVIAALVFAACNAAGYMATGGFIQSYAVSNVGLDRTDVLNAVTYGAVIWAAATYLTAIASDRFGRIRVYQIGHVVLAVTIFPLFWLLNTGEISMFYVGLTFFALGLGGTYGAQAALYSEMFPASIRFSGVSISYALGSIVGGAFAPMIAAYLVQQTGTTTSVSFYLLALTAVSLVAVSLIRDRSGINLSINNEAEQAIGALVTDKRPIPATVKEAAVKERV